MYKFIDVMETSGGVSLPSEALKINGEFIENLITGYRTLTVEGREALSPELSTDETGIRDGSTIKNKRYPARIIRVTYQLIAASNEAFRAAYNKLASILDVTDAELIFNDETDKYFTGTPSYIGEVPPGTNSVVGEFEILCADPFKYSIYEHEVVPVLDSQSILIDYGGTYKAYPKLTAKFYNESETSEDGGSVTALTGAGDCGYVAFFNEDEKIIQLGDPEESDDEEAFEPSQTLCNALFTDAKHWGTAAKSLWALNSGITSSSAVKQTGNLGMKSNTEELVYAKTQTLNVLNITSTAEAPYVYYTVTFSGKRTAETTVKLTITVSARLGGAESYFRKGYVLQAHFNIYGTQRTVTLKNSKDEWEGTTVHKKSFDYTINNVSSSTKALTGIKFWTTREAGGGSTGLISETTLASFPLDPYVKANTLDYYLAPTDFGSGSDWHGPSISRTIPADTSGEVGAKNFRLTYQQKMSIGNSGAAAEQKGAFQCLVVSGTGSNRKILAGVNVYKGSTGTKANLRFYLNGTVKETTSIDLSVSNPYFRSTKSQVITKVGNTVTFNISGITRTYRDDAIAEMVANEFTFTFTEFGTDYPLTWNGLLSAKFVKDYCETNRDIPNKFSANDIVEADCKTGEIFLNGVPAPGYGALGNDWEDFCLKPGLNQIGFSYSDWVASEYAPEFSLKYREVFI